MIIKAGWRPNPEPEAWDGKTALAQDGQEVCLTAGFRKQVGKMIQEGHWGRAIPLRTIKNMKESGKERERRLQELCDNMIILQNARPIPVNSGDRLVCVKHAWPWEYEWEWGVGHIPIKKSPFHHVPCWVFEEDNPVSATARMVFAFLCSRGLLNIDEMNRKQLEISVSKKNIGRALLISEHVAGRALLELEDLGLLTVEQLGLKYKEKKTYCNFYNANYIHAIEDPGRWTRIKAAQAEPRNSKLSRSLTNGGPPPMFFCPEQFGCSMPRARWLHAALAVFKIKQPQGPSVLLAR